MDEKKKYDKDAAALPISAIKEEQEVQIEDIDDVSQLIDLLKRIEQQIEGHKHLNPGKKKYFLKEMAIALERFDGLIIPHYLKSQYKSLISGGNELMKEIRRSNQFTAVEGKIAYYLRYVIASSYDFRNEIKPLRIYARLMLIAAAGFMLLTPQFYGYILPIIFIVPLFVGLKGLKKRGRTALYMSMAVLPMSFLSSITYIAWCVRTVIPDYAGTLAQVCATYSVTETLGHIWLIGFGIAAPLIGVCAVLASYYGVKYYRMYI